MRGSTAGLPETISKETTKHYLFLTILDLIFSSVILGPLVVGYWRSVWELMGIYVYPDDPLLSSIISTLIGIIGHLIFALLQDVFEHYFHPDKNRILYYITSRIYTVCFSFVCVNGWRGPWHILDLYTAMNFNTVLSTTLVGIVALGAMRALRNVSAPPCLIVTDYVKGYFEVLTMFRVSVGERTSLYILDCLFSVLIVGTLVVFVWRGAWVLLDIFLFPEDEVLSAWGSLILGYLTVVIAFLLQPIMKWLCDRFTGALRLFFADIFLIFSLFSTVNVWRGIWNLLNLYLLPDNLELSCWITHWICLIILILLGCSNSLLVRGVYIDAEEPAGKCVIFPCYYLRVIFQREKFKKAEKQQQQIECIEKIKIDKLCSNINENNHISIVNVHENDNKHQIVQQQTTEINHN